MSRTDSPNAPRTRRDGWTAERQLRFLEKLAATRSIREAAAATGMSREGAYRFRNRRDGALFAALWDIALEPACEVHTAPLTAGRLMRLLGNHFRRERGDFSNIGRNRGEGAPPDPTLRL
jgi:hypothetical protein